MKTCAILLLLATVASAATAQRLRGETANTANVRDDAMICLPVHRRSASVMCGRGALAITMHV